MSTPLDKDFASVLKPGETVNDVGLLELIERLRGENADLKASLAAMAGLTGEQTEQLRAENERLREQINLARWSLEIVNYPMSAAVSDALTLPGSE